MCDQNYLVVVKWLIIALLAVPAQFAEGRTASQPNDVHMHAAANLLFAENRGQVIDDNGNHRADILFTAHSGGTQVFLTATGISYQFTKVTYPDGYDPHKAQDLLQPAAAIKNVKKETYRFSLSLAGANAHPAIRKELKNAYTENYYTTGCPEGITIVGAYERLVYENVYPHIDWVVYRNGSGLKYDFVVHKGGDPKQIKLQIDDAESVQITNMGELLMKTTLGEIREQAPVSYDMGNKALKTTFKKNSDGTIGFEVDAPTGKELRIDPSVAWATYYGGSGDDIFGSCATDKFGNVYVAGFTSSTNSIAVNGYQLTYGGGTYDAMLIKFSPAGSPIWATYYGGSNDDLGWSCATDTTGSVYLAGSTQSAGLATAGAYQQVFQPGTVNAYSSLLVKFNSSGTRLWATYYGISNAIVCRTDAQNNVYMAGNTNGGGSISLTGASQPAPGGGVDAYIAKFDSLGVPVWGTYYGGSGPDNCIDLALDASGDLYALGTTSSTNNIATPGTYQQFYSGTTGNYALFLVKFSPAGTRSWGTYLGNFPMGTGVGGSLAVDKSNNIYVASGTTSTSTAASPGAYQSVYGGGTYDAFLAKFNTNGSRLWETYYGGSGNDYTSGIAIDNADHIFMTGGTSSATGIATYCADRYVYNGGSDGFMAQFDTAGIRTWASYTGYPGVMALDHNGNIYMAGGTNSAFGLATPGAYQTTSGGGYDGLLVKFSTPPIVTPTLSTGTVANPLCKGYAVGVPFTVSGTINSCNVFTAQLSDASGSFAAPVTIGTDTGTASGTIQAIIPTNTPSGTGYRIRVVSSNIAATGSDNGMNLTIAISIGQPTFAPGATSARCQGMASTAFPATATNAPTIAYSLDSTTAAFSGNSIDTLTGTVTYAAGWTGIATIKARVNGCNGVLTVLHTDTTKPTPAQPGAFIAATNPVCQGQALTYSVPATAGVSYLWAYTGAGITLAGTGSSIQATFDNTATAGTLQVAALLNGCASAPRAIGITVNPAPQVAITASLSHPFCPADSVVLTAGAATGLVYQWLMNNTAIPGEVGNVFTAYITGAYAVAATNAYNCTTVSNIIPVSSTPAVPTITPQGPTTLCLGDSILLQANTLPGIIYYWKLNGIYISAATQPAYMARVTGTYTVYESDGTCVATDTPSQRITVNILPPAIITTAGPAFFCLGSSVTLHTDSGATVPFSYQYMLDGTPIPGATTQYYTTTTIGNYTVKVTTAVGCSLTSSIYPVAYLPQPVATATPQASTSICSGDSLVIDANAGAGFSYQWLQNDTIIPGAIAISYKATTQASYAVQVKDPNGCFDTSAAVLVNVTAAPLATTTPAGSVSLCAPNSITLTADTGTGLSYQWQQNGAAINGATNVALTASTTGSYAVKVFNGSCTVNSLPVQVTINPLPVDTLIVYAPGVICGSGTVLLQTTMNPGYQYQWLLNSNNITGATTAFYNAAAPGTYSVRVTSAAGCAVTTLQSTIGTGTVPTPIITYDGYYLCANGYAAYQWYFDGQPIPGDTTACITHTRGGGYTVVVANSTGCSATSPLFSLSTGIANIAPELVKLYPNPATNMVYISAPEKVNAALSTIDGRQLDYLVDATSIDISTLANAVYLIRIYDKNDILLKVEKLVKAAW